MFDSKVDVAAIMQEIKRSVLGDMDNEYALGNEAEKIADFIHNTRKENEPYMEIGLRLPQALRFPAPVRKMIVLFSRLVRKSTRFIAKDQIIVNHNVDACIKALVEREDAIRKELESRIAAMERENKILIKKLDTIKPADRTDGRDLLPQELYVEFENRFRGSQDEIFRRLDYYVKKCLEDEAGKENEVCIDLGCGRGEWLKKMQEAGYRAVGVDINAEMVLACREQQLEAYKDDAIHFLQRYEDNSVSVVSAFQVIEHISKADLLELLKETYRVLKPNGRIILETPNICNIEVGTSAFQLDPTHINPMHPELTKFLAEYAGYRDAEIVYWKEEEIEQWVESVIAQDDKNGIDSTVVRVMLESMKRLVYSSPDYALIATK